MHKGKVETFFKKMRFTNYVYSVIDYQERNRMVFDHSLCDKNK